jgi:hypothetical protein
MDLLAQTDFEKVERGYRSLIFVGLFFLAIIVATMWWLKRQV